MGMDLRKEMRKVSQGLQEKLLEALHDSQAADLDDVKRVLNRKCLELFGDEFEGFEMQVCGDWTNPRFEIRARLEF